MKEAWCAAHVAEKEEAVCGDGSAARAAEEERAARCQADMIHVRQIVT